MTIANQRPENKSYIYLVLILSIGLIVRLFTFSQVFEKGRIVFLEADPYYHMWRVFSYIDLFPKTFFFDSFINYPYGVVVGWPPLFDQNIALISLIVPYSGDSPYETRLLKGYDLRYDNSNISINISENDILKGNIIKVNL